MMTNDTYQSMSLSETEMKNLIRNTLMVAGQEMGATGEHWPVIQSTITDIMRDWEQLEIERAVHAEMKSHLYVQLQKMKEILKTCTPEVRADVAPQIIELEEVYNAFFEDVKEDIIYLADEEDDLYLAADENIPLHIRRAEAIIDTLDEEE
ncbi:MAG: hypothetical protein AB7S81_09440 [Bdellovibrionales bacterium]